ncbi:LOW QUALITY PROTEIN: olfactory receptor 5G9-like [Sylvia borin]
MAGENEMFASEFILLGFTTQVEPQVMLFVLFLALYMVTLLGNLGVIVLIRINPSTSIHTPTYFFLIHVSLLDICYSSTIIPWSQRDFLVEKKVISFARCITLFSFATWCHVLAATAHDHDVPICWPLLYSVPMSQRICVGMLARTYLAGVLSSTLHTVSIFHVLSCCSRAIKRYFCNGPTLLSLSCSDTRTSKAVVATVLEVNVLNSTAFILVSSSSILAATLRICSAAGRHKAMPTSASHVATLTTAAPSSSSGTQT